MTLYKQTLGDSRKENLPFYRKKLPAEQGSGRVSHVQRLVGWWGCSHFNEDCARDTGDCRHEDSHNLVSI